MNLDELTFDVSQEVEIKAAPGTVFKNMTTQLAQIVGGDEKPMNFVLEEWPGGRWFRDLGNGQGHLWGFVQVIKPPTLLEIAGPTMMSYPVSGHVQFRLTPIAGGTLLTFRHRAFGLIVADHRDNVAKGWAQILQKIKEGSEK
jgi:uncharacterized protein YndB with AHSA1/START domain